MDGLQILDQTDSSGQQVSAFSLVGLLEEFRHRVEESSWYCHGVSRVKSIATEADQLVIDTERITGPELLLLASRTPLFVKGKLVAEDSGKDTPWLLVTAVDGTCIVESTDPNVLHWVCGYYATVGPKPTTKAQDAAVEFLTLFAGPKWHGRPLSKWAVLSIGVVATFIGLCFGLLGVIGAFAQNAELHAIFILGMLLLAGLCAMVALACFVPRTRSWSLPAVAIVIAIMIVVAHFGKVLGRPGGAP